MYASTDPSIAPMDGSHITVGVLCVSPTSRGVVKIASKDPVDNPVIDPRYFTTEHDGVVIRAGMRTALKAMESEHMQQYLEGETPPPGMLPVNSDSSDEELDR